MRGLVAWMLTLACCAPAVAQQHTPEPSESQRCLRHEAGDQARPVFPIQAYNDNVGGRVQVELEFLKPDRAPRVSVLLHEGEEPFRAAVEEHVRGLRLPCLPPAASPVRLTQEYVFAKDQRQVHWSRVRDPAAERRNAQWKCLVHASGFRSPPFPPDARRMGIQGRVLARLTFVDAANPPQAEVFHRPNMGLLANEIRQWVTGYRLPCHDAAGPMVTTFTFEFRFEGENYGFRDVNLQQFLGSTRGIREQTLQLDTTQMACPFELHMEYRRPALDNVVGEPGEPVPARRPLLEWLASAELDLGRDLLDAIHGDDFKLAVPCIRIDLKPKEK